MGYWMQMIEFISRPFTEDEIKNIIINRKMIKLEEEKRIELEYNEQMKLKPEFRKEEYKRKRSAKKPIGNKYWEEKLIDGEWIKVPIEPDNEINEVFVDGKGYIPINRLGDIQK